MENKKLKIGIIGCGTIGSQLAQQIDKKFLDQAKLCALCDIDRNKAEYLKANSSSNPEILNVNELIPKCDLIIEAACAKVAYEIAQKALQSCKDVMIMSVGGILDRYKQLFSLAQTKGKRIYLPSGALCGLDAVKSAAMAKINRVTLITRKPLQGLAGAPYLAKKAIDLNKVKKETVIFEGTALEAIKGFPKNINICATLSIAGIGPEKTKVKIVTSPDYQVNMHEIQVEGDFGKLVARTENTPSPKNPKTSFLAPLSAIATINSILSPVKVGT